jgi:hypothetical protein
MMEDSLLVQNDLKRRNVSTPLLFAYAMSDAVQMGILFYSGQTLSLSGKAALPILVGNVSLLIAAVFMVSIAFMYFFPQHTVRYIRYFTVLELGSILALILPLPLRVKGGRAYLSTAFLYSGLRPFRNRRADGFVRQRESGDRTPRLLRFLRRPGG